MRANRRARYVAIAGFVLVAGCTELFPPTIPVTPTRPTADLLSTYWRLAELEGEVIGSDQAARRIHIVMQPKNQRVTGFSGCNDLMGSYVLDGKSIRFAQMGGTMMACDSGMNVEKRFLEMFGHVARWEISGETLELLDADGKPLAKFEARTAS